MFDCWKDSIKGFLEKDRSQEIKLCLSDGNVYYGFVDEVGVDFIYWCHYLLPWKEKIKSKYIISVGETGRIVNDIRQHYRDNKDGEIISKELGRTNKDRYIK